MVMLFYRVKYSSTAPLEQSRGHWETFHKVIILNKNINAVLVPCFMS